MADAMKQPRKIEAAQRELRSLGRRMDAEYPGDGNEEAMTAFIALVEEYDRKARALRKMKKAAGAVFLSAFQPKAPNLKRALSR